MHRLDYDDDDFYSSDRRIREGSQIEVGIFLWSLVGGLLIFVLATAVSRCIS